MPRKNPAELTDGGPVHGRRSAAAHPQENPIGRQAMKIIEQVLSPNAECDDNVRQRLRRHVAARPGHPELALLEHVLAIRKGHGPSSW